MDDLTLGMVTLAAVVGAAVEAVKVNSLYFPSRPFDPHRR